MADPREGELNGRRLSAFVRGGLSGDRLCLATRGSTHHFQAPGEVLHVREQEAGRLEPTGMFLAQGSVAESSAASGVAYGEGAFLAVLIIVCVFVIVAYTGGDWFVGAGLLVAGVAALFIFLTWHRLADYPLTYRDGDRPRNEASGASLYENWSLESGRSVTTTFDVDDASDAESLAGSLHLEYGCSAARVDWRIYADADDDLLASGTFREGQERDLTNVAVRRKPVPSVVRLIADRTDSANCNTTLYWENPGLEGPGHGRFRFVFPVSGT
jgi:hypothetical protein